MSTTRVLILSLATHLGLFAVSFGQWTNPPTPTPIPGPPPSSLNTLIADIMQRVPKPTNQWVSGYVISTSDGGTTTFATATGGAEVDPIWGAVSNEYATRLGDVEERADEAYSWGPHSNAINMLAANIDNVSNRVAATEGYTNRAAQAYSWGAHSNAGYARAVNLDNISNRVVKTEDYTNRAAQAYSWGAHSNAGYARAVNLDNISNRVVKTEDYTNRAVQAYSWGAHSNAGYARAVNLDNISNRVVKTEDYTNRAAQAYSWGAHSNAGYARAVNLDNISNRVAATEGYTNRAAQAYSWGDHAQAGYARQSEFNEWATNFEFSSTSYIPRVGSSTISRDGTNTLRLSLGGDSELETSNEFGGWLRLPGLDIGGSMTDGYFIDNTRSMFADMTIRSIGGLFIESLTGTYIDDDGLRLDGAPPLYGFARRYISAAAIGSGLISLSNNGSGTSQNLSFRGSSFYGYTNGNSRWHFVGAATNYNANDLAGGVAYDDSNQRATMVNNSGFPITHIDYQIQSNSFAAGKFSVMVNGNPQDITLVMDGNINRVMLENIANNGDTISLEFQPRIPIPGYPLIPVELKYIAAFGPRNPAIIGRVHDLYAQSVMVDDPKTQRGASNKRYTDTGDAATLSAARAETWSRTQGTDLQATPFRWSPRYTTQGEQNNLVTRYGGGIAEAIYGQSATIIPEIKHFSVNAGDVVTMSVWAWSDMITNLAPEVSTDLMTWTRLSPTNIISSQMLDWFTAQIVFANSDTNALFVRLVDTTGGSGTILKRLLGTYEAYNLRATERVYVGSLTNSYLYRSGTNLMYRASDGREVVVGTEDLSPLVARWSSYPATNRVTLAASSTSSGYPHAIGSFNPSHRIDMLSYSQGSGTISTGALVYAPRDPTHRLWFIDGNGTNAVLTEASIDPVNIMTVGSFNMQKLSLFRNLGFAFPSTSTDPGLPGMMFVTNGYLVTFDAQSNRWGRVQLDYGW